MHNNSYENLDYELRTSMLESTKMGIYKYLKENNSDDVSIFINWFKKKHEGFLFSHRDFVCSRLLEFGHFDVTDQLFQEKPFSFDTKIAKSCSFNLSLSWKKDFFDYFIEQVNNNNNRFEMIKDFWKEFLNFQFQRPEEVDKNSPNLIYIFDKISFYEKSPFDCRNSSLIKARQSFFNKDIFNLPTNEQKKIHYLFGKLCGEHYLEFSDAFKEEFQYFPETIKVFEKYALKNELDNTLIHNDMVIKKIKI